MSLIVATNLTAFFLIFTGSLFLWNPPSMRGKVLKSLRSQPVAIITMTLGGGWFLYEVTQLGVADFGDYKNILFFLFLAVAVLSFFYVKDFLAVRGGCILVLMAAKVLLGAAYMQDPISRLSLVVFVYAGIVVALYLAATPYRMRDFFEWLFQKHIRPRVFGSALSVYGLILFLVSFSY